MKIQGKSYRSIWEDASGRIMVIDQRKLPHRFKTLELNQWQDTAAAISNMTVRGAPLIGVTAAYGLYLAICDASNDNWLLALKKASEALQNTRPTAVNLAWALRQQMLSIHASMSKKEASERLLNNARQLANDDISVCKRIGESGLKLIREIANRKQGGVVNILTHCNAGWLGCIDWGTATAPLYMAHHEGIAIHVWVDETRPRLQGARLTTFELGQENIPYHLITDNAGGLLMQQGKVDICLLGTDRTVRNGDVANKIGTYLKALAAYDNKIPFYIALPSSSIDWEIERGSDIPIEERDANEVKQVEGQGQLGIDRVSISPDNAAVYNPGFDITPARFISGLITEHGICKASEAGLLSLFPDLNKS